MILAPFPLSFLKNHLYGCKIGKDSFIGPFVEIPKGVVIRAGAVITKDILVSGIYVGNPARLLRKYDAIGIR